MDDEIGREAIERDWTPSAALSRILADIHAHADDSDFIDNVGCGPLESLFHQGHGEEVWSEVETLARTDPLFRRALRSVWAYSSPEYDRREALLAELSDEE